MESFTFLKNTLTWFSNLKYLGWKAWIHYTVTDLTRKECVSCTKFSHPRSFLYTVASTFQDMNPSKIWWYKESLPHSYFKIPSFSSYKHLLVFVYCSIHFWKPQSTIAATQSSKPLDSPLAPQSKYPFTCLPSAERGRNHMVQDQETTEVEKHPSTTRSKLLVHKQWVTYKGIANWRRLLKSNSLEQSCQNLMDHSRNTRLPPVIIFNRKYGLSAALISTFLIIK